MRETFRTIEENLLVLNRTLATMPVFTHLLNPPVQVLEARKMIWELHKRGRHGTGLDGLQVRLDYVREWGRAYAEMLQNEGDISRVSAKRRPYIGLPTERDLSEPMIERLMKRAEAEASQAEPLR